MSAGSSGWDEYAPFYDWENARTLGRRDLAYWRSVLGRAGVRTLELGCGTGRLLVPLARAGIDMVGIDLSAPMLRRARVRARRMALADRPAILRGDIRALPFRRRAFGAVMAPYGLLQSLVNDRDLDAALAEIHRVLPQGGLLGVDLVPDLETWQEYEQQVSLKGRLAAGTSVTLIESVRQERRRRLTIFDEQFVVRRGRRVTRHRFSLTFRTLPFQAILARLERAGFRIDGTAGSYAGAPWTADADVWLVRARRR
jgi:ubiquinone/menaquinone biosynthesis C-methylase UbiE